jgi:Tfp pilus tip-associated adhesin PilY1
MSNNCKQENGVDCTDDQNTKLATAGWRIQMEQTEGEKVLSRPLIVNGVIYFSSYLPPGTSTDTLCGPDEGSGLNYAVSLHDASAPFDYNLSNSVIGPNGELIQLQKGDRYYSAGAGIPSDPIVITKDGNNYIQASGDPYLHNASSLFANRTYWYIEGE